MAEAAPALESLRPPSSGGANPSPSPVPETTSTGNGANGSDATLAQSQPSSAWYEPLGIKDEKRLEFAKRFKDPSALLDKAWNADQLISKGLHKAGLPENPTPEQLTEYRKVNGIPETPEGYWESMPEGLVVGEIDKPVVDEYSKVFQELGLNSAQGQRLLKAYYEINDKRMGEAMTADKVAHAAMHEALKKEWGHEYDFNRNQTENWLSKATPEAQQALAQAKMPDGTSLMHNPDFVRYLSSVAREIMPVPSIVGGEGGSSMSAGGVDNRIAELRAEMRKKDGPYWQGPKASDKSGRTVMQAEYEHLIAKRDQVANRGR